MSSQNISAVWMTIVCVGASAFAQEPMMHEVAVKAVRPAGAPEYADVCFRYMAIRKAKFPTLEDAKQAMAAFHATRVDWFYPGYMIAPTPAGATKYVSAAGKAFIDWCHARNMKVGGALIPLTRNEVWKLRDKGRWDLYLGDSRNPGFTQEMVKWGQGQINAGVDSIVVDGFFNYKDQNQKTLFHDKVIKVIKAHKPGFTIAANNGHFIGTEYVKSYAYDFHYSDCTFREWKPSSSRWWAASKEHRALGSALLVHPNRLQTTEDHRKLVALSYASGSHLIVPWDQFIFNYKEGSTERLFANPADYADLYGFARVLGQMGYLNGYEDAAVGGYDLKEDRYGDEPPIAVSGGSGKLSIFGRAKPGEATAPLVFHLVEWGTPKAAQVRLRLPALYGTANVDCKLLAPPAFNERVHAQAEAVNDYKTLTRTAAAAYRMQGDTLVVSLPAVAPWGVLIVRKAETNE